MWYSRGFRAPLGFLALAFVACEANPGARLDGFLPQGAWAGGTDPSSPSRGRGRHPRGVKVHLARAVAAHRTLDVVAGPTRAQSGSFATTTRARVLRSWC